MVLLFLRTRRRKTHCFPYAETFLLVCDSHASERGCPHIKDVLLEAPLQSTPLWPPYKPQKSQYLHFVCRRGKTSTCFPSRPPGYLSWAFASSLPAPLCHHAGDVGAHTYLAQGHENQGGLPLPPPLLRPLAEG